LKTVEDVIGRAQPHAVQGRGRHLVEDLIMKILKIVGMLVLIAQKKRPDSLNTAQKTQAICNVLFLNKSRKTAKNGPFLNAAFQISTTIQYL
jgi:hypothetical protein